jgi:cytochrome c peroxidase
VTGACALCHGGAHAQPDHQFLPLPVPTGTRFQTVNVYERNLNNPVRHFIFRNPDGSETSVWSPDPGRALITGAIDGDSTANGAPFFTSLNSLKIPTLWGVKNTAPYFHDNSAKTLEQLVDHYADFVFAPLPPELGFQATPQDRADIVAYLKLL